MASNFPAYVAMGADKTNVFEFVPATGASEPFVTGSFVVLSTGESSEVEVCPTDPILILGISEGDSAIGATLTANGRVPIRVLTDGVIIALGSSTTPAYTHVGNSYGITVSGTNWLLDTAKTTTSSRCRVVAVDIPKGIFYVTMHGASATASIFQFSNIISAVA